MSSWTEKGWKSLMLIIIFCYQHLGKNKQINKWQPGSELVLFFLYNLATNKLWICLTKCNLSAKWALPPTSFITNHFLWGVKSHQSFRIFSQPWFVGFWIIIKNGWPWKRKHMQIGSTWQRLHMAEKDPEANSRLIPMKL